MESGRVETPDDLPSGRREEELVEVLDGALAGLHVLTSKFKLAEEIIETITVDERHEDAYKARLLEEYMHDMYI